MSKPNQVVFLCLYLSTLLLCIYFSNHDDDSLAVYCMITYVAYWQVEQTLAHIYGAVKT